MGDGEMKIEIPETLEIQRDIINELTVELGDLSKRYSESQDTIQSQFNENKALRESFSRFHREMRDPPVVMTEDAKAEFDKLVEGLQAMSFWSKLKFLFLRGEL